jgi:hypothetical protein
MNENRRVIGAATAKKLWQRKGGGSQRLLASVTQSPSPHGIILVGDSDGHGTAERLLNAMGR